MTKFFKLLPVLILFAVEVYGQSPQVPHKMNIGGITLVIKDDARREIQKDVDALTQSPKYFNIKVERAKTYFPVIEKVFKEERVPDELKYLVLQESALIADAVSTSNAVGFWQFKDFTAIEMGLKVNEQIDERMNIASSSKAAAGYLKKNNFYFNNWIYAVQAYQMGAGAALKVVDEKYFGAKHMDIDSRTYWYVKKFLAHVVAFEGSLKGRPQVQITTVDLKERKTVTQLSRELKIDEAELREFNKWIRKDVIPGDKQYALVLPNGKYDFESLNTKTEAATVAKAAPAHESIKASEVKSATKAEIFTYNGLPAIRGKEGERVIDLASRAGIDLSKFIRYNDLSIDSKIINNQPYYLKAKRKYGQEAYHQVLPNDKLWQVSQDYAIKLDRLKKLNAVYQDRVLKEGMILWMTSNRNQSVKTGEDDIIQLTYETFNWSLSPEQPQVSLVYRPQAPVPMEKNEVEVKPEIRQEQKIEVNKEDKKEQISAAERITVPSKIEHLVKNGETLFAISKQYDVAVQDLKKWNNLGEADILKPGQLLSIWPRGVETESENPLNEDKYHYYEVKDADTLYSIARSYDVSIKELMEWNGKKDFDLTRGEKLRILKK